MAKSLPKPKVIADTEPPSGMPPVRLSLTLDEVVGQGRAIDLLRGALASGRVHHAWIFGGPPGVGKFTAALGFAAMLLDPTVAPDLSGRLAPDPESRVQRLLREGAHPDLHVITKELAAYSRNERVRDAKQRAIPIEVVREFLIEPAGRTRVLPGESRAGKVFIIDEAELLRPDAQDTLLKTLEEPPTGTVIILVTASEDRLSPTIRSRCQRVGFVPLDDAALGRWIDANVRRDGRPLGADERAWLVRFAGGSPGWAAAAADHALYTWDAALGPLLAEARAGRLSFSLGSEMARLVQERAEAWVKANPEASKEAANVLWARRLFAYLAEQERLLLRDAAARGAGPTLEARLRAIELVEAAERQVAANVNAGLVMENLAAQMTGAAAT